MIFSRIPLGVLICFFSLSVCRVANSADLDIVRRWLSTNAGTETLKVDFVQSRTLKALKTPLTQNGTLWMNYATHQFRWQLGDPPKTIVVSQGDKIAIMRTLLKRVEFREANGSSGSSSGFGGMTNGFPRTLEAFQSKYRILDIVSKGNAYEVITRPLGPDGEGVSQFGFVLDKERFLLKGLVIELKDGSNITTTFHRINRNLKIDPKTFNPDLTGYRKAKFRAG